jgi:hypothetical protein
MGTRAYITVGDLKAGLYRHHDGYPDSSHGVLASLVPFCQAFVADRGDDQQYFLARLVENQINATDQKAKATGFGIIDVGNKKDMVNHVDCAHHYHVNLETRTIVLDGNKSEPIKF